MPEGMTVGDLDADPDATVYRTGRSTAGRQAIHTTDECPAYQSGRSQYTVALGEVPDHWPVCRRTECEGDASDHGGNPEGCSTSSTRFELLDTDPSELGLSPLGSRAGGDD